MPISNHKSGRAKGMFLEGSQSPSKEDQVKGPKPRQQLLRGCPRGRVKQSKVFSHAGVKQSQKYSQKSSPSITQARQDQKLVTESLVEWLVVSTSNSFPWLFISSWKRIKFAARCSGVILQLNKQLIVRPGSKQSVVFPIVLPVAFIYSTQAVWVILDGLRVINLGSPFDSRLETFDSSAPAICLGILQVFCWLSDGYKWLLFSWGVFTEPWLTYNISSLSHWFPAKHCQP